MDADVEFSNTVMGQTLPLTIYPLEDWKAGHAQSGGTSAHTLVTSML